MWCLETIVQLNEKAAELARLGKPEIWAYQLCGINHSPASRTQVQQEYEDAQRKRLKVEVEEEAA